MDDQRLPEPICSLEAHLPVDRRRALAEGAELAERAQGSAVFADLSGFTPLMELLANSLGPQQGAEELTHLLNAIFTPMIGEVHRCGGSILSFAGDAMTCWFAGEPVQAGRRAAAAALAMQRHLADYEMVETPAGVVHLSMHIGVASGPVRRFQVGRPPHGLLDVLAGQTLDRMAQAQHHAGPGQVVVDAATAAHLPAAWQRPLESGFVLLQDAAASLLDAGPEWPLPPALPLRQVRQWLAEPLYRRLQAGEGAFAAELRLVTSMFIQFAGLDYDRDPQVGAKLQRYVALTQEQLAPYEGHLGLVACGDKGSLMLILFGAPIAHEDDPERAVGFALAFRQKVQELPFIQDQRIGISMGRVYAGVLGGPQRGTYTVLGDEVNLSARLMQTAAAGQILVSQWVRQSAGGSYTFQALGAVSVKGKEKPVPIFEPTALRERLPPRTAERLVGREEERAQLSALLERVESGAGQVLQIEGQAGVGKSALLRSLLQEARERGWRVHLGTGLSYGQSTPYLPWRTVLESIAGLSPEMAPPQRVTLLEQAVGDLPPPGGRPAYWWARFPLLAELMGLEVPDTPLTRALEGELRRDNTFRLLEALVRQQAAERPALFVLEDAHWADELSLALAAQIARGLEQERLLLILLHRPFAPTQPPSVRALGQLSHRTSLCLATLSAEASRMLASQQLQAVDLPAALLELLRERAQGNPLFIEELLRALQQGGHLQRHDGAVTLSGAWEELELPDTIEGLVRARMDRLPEEERLTLKVSSVIGRTFRRHLLSSVHPAQPTSFALDRQLRHLGQADFTQLEEPAPEWRYAFRQTILHEVTYETLLFAQRRQLHGAIGGVLEEWHAGELGRVLDLLAYHYARSAEREKALTYLQQAAERARREYANEVALGHYSQALERLQPEELALRYDLLAGRERVHDLLGQRAAQEEDLLALGRLAVELSDPQRQVEVLNRRARRAVDMGAFEQAREFALQAYQEAENEGELGGAAKAQRILGIVKGSLGEYERALAAFDRSLENYGALGDRQGQADCLISLGTAYFYQGEVAQARSYYERALQQVRLLGNRLQETRVLINLALAQSNLGDYESALHSLEQTLNVAQEIGSLNDEALALANMGVLQMNLGNMVQSEALQQRALQLARLLGDLEGEASALTGLAMLYVYQAKFEPARRSLQQALGIFQDIGHRRGEAVVLHSRGIVELEAGEPAAVDYFRQALGIRREIGEGGNLLLTQSWLGRACLLAGQPQQAVEHIQRALERLAAEGYGGDNPEQEVWWSAYRVWQVCGEPERARAALERAHGLVQEQAGRIQEPAMRRSFLENVPINRQVVRAWEEG